MVHQHEVVGRWRLIVGGSVVRIGVSDVLPTTALRGKLGGESLECRNLLAGDLLIAGVVDGPLSGGTPKAIELYAVKAIPDLSVYGIGAANNGGGTDGVELVLSGSATAGQHLVVASEGLNFQAFFGFTPDFLSASASINGDDAIELFFDGQGDGFASPPAPDDIVADVFGEINVDGTGTDWEYLDGWAYRRSTTGPDGASFDLTNWEFSGANALDGESTNTTAASPFPIGTYAASTGPEIDVQGNGQSISAGDTSPDTADGTDFGSVNSLKTQTYVIDNSVGSSELAISNISLSGPNASDFAIGTVPATVAAGGSESFDITFTPTAAALHTATVSIESNDADESPYMFAIQGTGTTAATNVVINEVDADTDGDEDDEFVELYDGGVGNTSLDGLVLVLFNGNGSVAYEAYDLDGHSTDENGFFVLGDELTPNVDFVPSNFTTSSNIQNGEDAVALYIGDALDFADGSAAISTNLLDAVVYETGSDADSTLPTDLGTGQVIDENANGNATTESISRFPGGTGAFIATMPTPGANNVGIATSPEIDVTGNGQSISTGDDTPSLDDGTDFGSAVAGSSAIERNFTINNTGDGDLNLDTVSLAGSTDFSVTQPGNLTIAPGGSASFSVIFTPTTEGAQTATITVGNNDSDENPFTFDVVGAVTLAAVPEIEVSGNGLPIILGDDTPTTEDGTDFGSVDAALGSATRQFLIANKGTGILEVSSISVSGPNAEEFVVTQAPTTVAPGSTETIEVTFDPADDGARTATVAVQKQRR